MLNGNKDIKKAGLYRKNLKECIDAINDMLRSETDIKARFAYQMSICAIKLLLTREKKLN